MVHAKLLLSVDNLENKERERESLCLEIQFPGVVDPIHRERTTPALDVAHAEPGLRNRSLKRETYEEGRTSEVIQDLFLRDTNGGENLEPDVLLTRNGKAEEGCTL